MTEKNDWRLLYNVEYLYKQEINPTDGEELKQHTPELKYCTFCQEEVRDTPIQHWYLPIDQSCCICETCYLDFQEQFEWRLLDGWDISWPEKKF